MTTSSAGPRVDDTAHDQHHGGKSTALNWFLAILTIPAALAIVGYAYLQVLSSAGCTGGACSGLGPSQTVFGLILYGTPVVAVAAVVLSFFTARRPAGVLVPAIVWALLVAAVVTLFMTF